MDKDSAVLQGAFVVAEKLCAPPLLSCIQKAEWSKVGHIILEALGQVCRADCGNDPTTVNWRKRLICVVWLKLLCKDLGEDIETSWRENPFFCLQNGLPDVNSVILFELVKSMDAADTFASLLFCFPPAQICVELERMTRHVRSEPKSQHDMHFFLKVWWELWKGRDQIKAVADENTEVMFTNQLLRLFKCPSLSPISPKRVKLEIFNSPASLPHSGVLNLLLYALQDMKEDITSTELCCQALSLSLDAFYTSFFLDQEVLLPTREKMCLLSQVFAIKGIHPDELSPELVREAQRDLYASYTPAPFKASSITLSEALKIVTDLALFWQTKTDFASSSSPSYSAFQLNLSAQRVLTALLNTEMPEGEDKDSFLGILRGLLKTLVFTSTASRPDFNAKVTTTIIINHLKDCENFAALFASDISLVPDFDCLLDCLEKNQKAFQQCTTLISLSSCVISKLHSADVRQCKKLLKATVDIFSALSLEEKNKALTAMLTLSKTGFFGCSVPSTLSEGFEKELNMTFNCIIQGGSRGASQGNLNTAASLVARVAFQNPEATLKYCCHSAIFNKGTFHLMAEILQQLPGFKDVRERNDDESDVFSKCLQEVAATKCLSANEIEQLLGFVGLLMMPIAAVGTEKKGQSFLPPHKVVHTLVLPKLSAGGLSDIQLSLQLLRAALSVCVQEAEGSYPHWVMDCSPFPLLYILAQLHNQALRQEPPGSAVHGWSMDTKELLMSVLTTLGQLVGVGVAANPSCWSRALFWLYNKVEKLDWTVGFYLKPVWGEHFKNEVPSSLLAVCDLPEQEWSGLDLPAYGPGTGLLAWIECCSISDFLQSVMLSCLSLEKNKPGQISMFSKGLMVALTQVLPSCSVSQWSRLLRALKELITSARLHVPFSLEYVDFLPLLDLRRFSCELCMSVLLLRVLQLLCGSSCSHWLLSEGWAHVGRLYAHAVREILSSVGAKLPLPSSAALATSTTPASSECSSTIQSADTFRGAVDKDTAPCQEVLFVLRQLYCHIQHIQVMMPGGQSEPLFLSSLNLLSQYEAIMHAFPDSCTAVENDDNRHFFSTITDNLQSKVMKAVLHQKIAQLVSSTA
ncbi:gem-associated protein 4 isoform X2 [Gouania willdenowi]|uniref:gem-associated protein 4 isoform X2 n=1 Tax=Gouania willdenowi TaxID=441366 RepID=UPI001054D562|nr:gem-associated protein 4 isoform X2 [Gouania willdenowi]